MLMVVASTVFSSKFLDGHIIEEINHFDYLVDTGSPVSFGRGGSIFINGQKFLLNHPAMGVTPDSISALSGLHMDGLIGMDILSKFDIRFSLNEIHFFDTGAQLSYVSNDLFAGVSTGERRDFQSFHRPVHNECQRERRIAHVRFVAVVDGNTAGYESSERNRRE